MTSARSPDATALDVAYAARFNKHLEKAPHLYLKSACKVGEKIWVEVNPDFPTSNRSRSRTGKRSRFTTTCSS